MKPPKQPASAPTRGFADPVEGWMSTGNRASAPAPSSDTADRLIAAIEGPNANAPSSGGISGERAYIPASYRIEQLERELAAARQEHAKLIEWLRALAANWEDTHIHLSRTTCAKELLKLLPPVTNDEGTKL